jgi:DNA-binding SARP family transcriptional activator
MSLSFRDRDTTLVTASPVWRLLYGKSTHGVQAARPLEVAEDGRPVLLGGSRALALLALLLVHRNQVLAIDRIVDELWAERPPKTGGQVVRVYVSQLRKAREQGRSNGQPRALVTQRNGHLLRADTDQVDVDRFEALQAEGRRLLAAGEIADSARTLEKALSLWRGPPLQDSLRGVRPAGDREA